MIRQLAASKMGVHYVAASSHRIRNEGESDLCFETEERQLLTWTFQIAEVNKVLASVAALVDADHRVVFDRDKETGTDISFITHKPTGKVVRMRRERNVWVIDAFMTEEPEQDFARQE